jgi:hypothetical protein
VADDGGIDLPAYVASQRVPQAVCAPCPHRVYCGGFPEMTRPAEPPWLVSREALVRRAAV